MSDVPWAQACAPRLDLSRIETPAYVIDLGQLRRNLQLLARVQARAGCKVILALKGFAAWRTFGLIKQYLAGTTASSVHEARLGREEFGGEVHAYAPAYSEQDIHELRGLVDHLVFNSTAQVQRYLPALQGSGIELGLRINPEHSELQRPLYDPCAAGSRLGVTRAELDARVMPHLSGLHFHTLCELNADSLERTLVAVEAKFGDLLGGLSWVNFGGGHHITRPGYDVERLIGLVRSFRERWGVRVYLEPGEAIALNAGVLVSSVLDLVQNAGVNAILDTSATAHMPDLLEMPYRAEVVGGFLPSEQPYRYRLGGLTCLAGDVIGEYSFEQPLQIGDRVVFLDMAHYTMVKNTTFNGVRLPSVVLHGPEPGKFQVVRRFGYQDYRGRLG